MLAHYQCQLRKHFDAAISFIGKYFINAKIKQLESLNIVVNCRNLKNYNFFEISIPSSRILLIDVELDRE